MATNALKGYQGFELCPGVEGTFEHFFGPKGATPSEEDWKKWLAKALDRESGQAYGASPEEAKANALADAKSAIPGFSLGTLYKYEPSMSNWVPVYPFPDDYCLKGNEKWCQSFLCNGFHFSPGLGHAEKVLAQGFVRRRSPDAGRTKAAFCGEEIPIPSWVIEAANAHVGEQRFQAPLPSGKPRPVRRR
jgi:hypothetical protein